jgi:tetratricopeptide (TPR) repeat protein
MNTEVKPKLVFFQNRYDGNIPEFLLIHIRDHVRCLAESFDVTVINRDCDYGQVCDAYQPDLALFESAEYHKCPKPKIANTHSNPQIPKLGLLNADAFSGSRAGLLSAMAHWGVETFFSISVTAAEHMPEIAENLFVWPNFIDPDVHRDYGEWKNIPVLLTGNTSPLYPWRRLVSKRIADYFPSLVCPHPGYRKTANPVKTLVGTDYARTINASVFVPSCGTVAKEIVRKHFEIPACKSCLVTEKSPALAAAGFIDMHNCIFADEHDILDKLEYLFQNPEQLEAITHAGHQLVHARHTLKHRNEIRQWFDLHKHLGNNQKIVQTSPFGELASVAKATDQNPLIIRGNGLHLAHLQVGNQHCLNGNFDAAEQCYLKCLNYLVGMPEAKLGLTLCNLYKGNAKAALSWIEQPIHHILEEYQALDPEPIEWAYYVITLLCLGKLHDASQLAEQFPWLYHPELERVRWVIKALQHNGLLTFPLPQPENKSQRRTIHSLPKRDFIDWLEQLGIMLRACGQCEMAELLASRISPKALSADPKTSSNWIPDTSLETGNCQTRPVFSIVIPNFYQRRMIFGKIKSSIKEDLVRFIGKFAAQFKKTASLQVLGTKNDDFLTLIKKLLQEEPINNALILGAIAGKSSTEAFWAGIDGNGGNPNVVSVSTKESQSQSPGFYVSHSKEAAAQSHVLALDSQDNHYVALENALKIIKQNHGITNFDAVFLDNSALGLDLPSMAELDGHILQGGRFIFLENTQKPYAYNTFSRLCDDPTYALIAHDPELRSGYAIFKQLVALGTPNPAPEFVSLTGQP